MATSSGCSQQTSCSGAESKANVRWRRSQVSGGSQPNTAGWSPVVPGWWWLTWGGPTNQPRTHNAVDNLANLASLKFFVLCIFRFTEIIMLCAIFEKCHEKLCAICTKVAVWTKWPSLAVSLRRKATSAVNTNQSSQT